MSKKFIISFIAIFIVIILVVVIYNYNRAQDSGDVLNINSNVNTQEEIIEGPSIKVSKQTHDFGIVVYGDVAEHIFKVENIGSESLEILRLSTSCGCTKAIIAEEDKIIAPGQSVDMSVTFDPAVHKDDSDLGNLTRIVYIKTNDPKLPEKEVEITANVVKAEKLKTIQVTAKKWEFVPNPIRAKKGDMIRLEITSIDVDHGLAIPDFNINEEIKSGQTIKIDFVANKTGVFDFYCSVFCGVGHSKMKGQLIIE